MAWFTNLLNVGESVQMAVPVSAATVNVDQGTTALLLNHPGLIALLTINLPSNPNDGQRLTIASGSAVTLLTISNGTVKGLITTLAVNGFARFIYSASAGAWFRTG